MDLSSVLGPRSVDDMLAERVRVQLGGETYVLPVKTMHAQREWEESLDGELARMLRLVQQEEGEIGDLIRSLSETSLRFVDLLLSYDDGNVLPDKDTIARTNTEVALMFAVLEVWRAGHPKADIGLGLFALRSLMLDPKWEGRTSTLSPNGDYLLDGSKPN
jgi:hypothetical protein